MKKQRILSLLLFLSVLFVTKQGFCSVHFSPLKLAKMGIEIKRFQMVALSQNGEVLLALEKTADKKMIYNGYPLILRALYFKNGTFSHLNSAYLPLKNLENLAISDDVKSALAVGDQGTKVLKITIPALQVSSLFQHKKGKPGFRCYPLMWFRNGSFYTSGYFYDMEGYGGDDWVTPLNLQKSGLEIFQKKWEVAKSQRAIGNVIGGWIVSDKEAFWTVRENDTLRLVGYLNGRVYPLDEGVSFGGLAATEGRVIYSVLRKNKEKGTFVKDIVLNKSWEIGEQGKPYNYLYLSNDGKTAIATLMDFTNIKMTCFYGKEEDRFQLKSIPVLKDVPFGTFRFAGNGKSFAFLNENGLIVSKIP